MPRPSPGTAARRADPPLVIHDLLSYRLGRAANLVSRSAAMRYRREFDVSLGEWRALALLAAGGPANGAPVSLNDLARAAGLDKAQMSRVVAGLIQRGLILRRMSLRGGRMVALTLTKAGARIYEGLIAAAAERDAMFRACLTPAELAALETALGKLAAEARRAMHGEPDQDEDGS
jgi:DNA-binding MarR family transcriptional regulator